MSLDSPTIPTLTCSPGPDPDPASAIAFLQKARPSGFWVLVSIDPEAAHGDPAKARGASFACSEADEVSAWILRENGEFGRNVYWTVNRVDRPIAKKPRREDVSAMEFLHVDVDVDKRKPLAEERARLESLLAEKFPASIPPPSIIVDSGGGLQLFWRLEEPLRIDGQEAAYEDAKRWNQQLEVLFGGDHCHNVDRIMRLPGTVNWPDAKKRAAGRTSVLASVRRIMLDKDERMLAYPLSDFTPAAPVQTPSLGFSVPRASVETSNVARLLSLDELPPEVPGIVKVVINLGRDPDNPRRWPSRSEPLFWVCCELVRCGVSDDVIYSILTDPDFGISESVLEKGPRAERFALHQIENARENAIDPALAELNRRHAVISDLGGKCRVVSESWDDVLDREHISIQTFEDFANRYSNRFINVETDKGSRSTPLGRWWLQHAKRRQFDRMVFAPGREVPGSYNLWRGFACEAVPGDCSLYLTHMLENICRGDAAIYEYVVSWMARAVQQPGVQGETSLVMRGQQGAGKGVFASTFGSLFGRHFAAVTNPNQIVGEFNELLRDAVVLFADEAFFAGDKRAEAVLKGLVTEDRRISSAKFQAAETARNCLHILMATNSDWVVPAGPHERRYLVLDVGDGSLQNKPYFRAIREQMDNGGREALLHTLSTRDLSAFDPRDVPRTAALQEQKEHSLPLEQEWWLAKLRAGQVREGEAWPEWVACCELQHDFSLYAQTWGRGQRVSATRLGRLLEKAGAARRQLGRKVNIITEDGSVRPVDRPRVFSLPTLPAARAAWASMMGGDFSWSDPETLIDRPTEEPYA